jgi:hypothetical protein
MYVQVFLIFMNISQNPLNRRLPKWLSEQNKDVENGMLDLAIQTMAALVLCALPFIFMGYVRSRVRHALKTLGKAH